MKTFALLIVGLFATSFLLQAQQLTNFNLYSQNKYTLNPANAGDQEHCLLFFNNRSQWVGVEGAPKTTMFGIHGLVSEKVGLGGYFYSDQTGVLKRNSFALSYSYRIQFFTNHFVSFGVSAGAVDQHIDYDQIIVENNNDNLVLSSIGDGYTFDAGVGIRYNWKDFEFGFAVPQLLETNIRHQSNSGDMLFSLERHYLLFASYDFYVENYDLKITPTSYFRSAEVGPTQLDVGVIGEWNNLVWFGTSYRQGGEYDFSINTSGIVLSMGMKLYEKVDFAYSYEMYKHGLTSESGGTHEVAIAYHFDYSKKTDAIINNIVENQDDLLYKIDSLQREIEKLKFDLEKIKNEFEDDKQEKQEVIDDLNHQLDSLKSLIDLKEITSLDYPNDSNLDDNNTENDIEDDSKEQEMQIQIRQLNDKIKQLNDRVFLLNNDENITALEENNAQLINSVEELKNHSEELVNLEKSSDDIDVKLRNLSVMEYSIDKIEEDLDNLRRVDDNDIIRNFSSDDIVTVDVENGEGVKIDKGFYVVVMSFRNYKYAIAYYNKLNTSGVKANIAHNRTRGFYYIYTDTFDGEGSEENAVEEKHNKADRYEGVWIYKYYENIEPE